MKKAQSGLTLIEIIVVVIIIGVLATLGIAQFGGPREQAVEKEASTNLKLLAASEKIYRLETNTYTSCNNAADCNTVLRLAMPTDNRNWEYKVTNTSSTFWAKAQRKNKPANAKVWCINETQDTEQTSGCPNF